MAQLFFVLIQNHMRTLSQVPATLQSAVQTLLTAAGLDANGNLTTVTGSPSSTTWTTSTTAS
jgi:hypothetical protein